MKILFADDNYLSREIAKSLEKENESYTIASNGKKALSAIDQGINNGDHFDLIFLFDILKGMEGATTLKEIRELEEKHRVSLTESSVITMFTTHNEESFFLSTLYADCDYFLQLPVNRLKLAMIMETTKNDMALKLPKSA
ncbi:MAG: response regulator [Proteobacteria bacterium]|nr:response regulator [Pseudomonadota bacterium]